MNRYLSESRTDIRLPKQWEEYNSRHNEIAKDLWLAQKKLSSEAGDFCLIGSMAYFILYQFIQDRESSNDLILKCNKYLKYYKLGNDVINRLVEGADRLLQGKTPFDDILSRVLRFTSDCLQNLDAGTNVSFISMPFRKPFDDRFSTFYQPLLERLNLLSFRAWGGLALEDYWDLLLLLIKKSTILFADLTGLNPNVIHEVGIAEGLDKTVLIVAESVDFECPSNFSYHAIVQYSTKTKNWQETAIADTVRVFDSGIKGMLKRTGINNFAML